MSPADEVALVFSAEVDHKKFYIIFSTALQAKIGVGNTMAICKGMLEMTWLRRTKRPAKDRVLDFQP